MRKKLSLLMAAVLLFGILAGCGSARRQIEFKQNLKQFEKEAAVNVQLMSTFLDLERVAINTKNIEDDQHAEEIVASGMNSYDAVVNRLKKQGEDVSDITIEAMGERTNRIEELFKKIDEDTESRQAFPDLYKNAALLYLDCGMLLNLMRAPYGPADEFEKEYASLIEQATEAAQALEDALYE